MTTNTPRTLPSKVVRFDIRTIPTKLKSGAAQVDKIIFPNHIKTGTKSEFVHLYIAIITILVAF